MKAKKTSLRSVPVLVHVFVPILILILLFCMMAADSSFAASGGSGAPNLVDQADLVTAEEESNLLETLEEISGRQQLDVVIVTAYTLNGKSPADYADDFFEENGYGFGEDRDGVLLLISMEDRDWWISTTGYGVTAFTDAGMEYLSEQFLPALQDGNYAKAFTRFAELCDDFITQAKSGVPYDIENMPKAPFNLAWNIFAAIVIGLIVAAIATSVMKGQLKTVLHQAMAENYVKNDSMKVTESRDLFLYHQVVRQRKQEEQESKSESRSRSQSGGSTTHTSSSGTTHGGTGGKF